MSNPTEPSPSINSWLEQEMYEQYKYNQQTVDDPWRQVFETNGVTAKTNGQTVNGNAPVNTQVAAEPAPAATAPAPAPAPETAAIAKAPSAPPVPAEETEPSPSEQMVPLRGAPLRIAENMNLSLSVPTATSQRVLPVRVVDENRKLANDYRDIAGQSKLSYTHFIGWAIVQALKSQPNLNNAYLQKDGESFRVVRNAVNFGLAIDVPGKDGTRSLLVPSIKNAGDMTFVEFVAAFDDLVARGRAGKLQLPDFQGTSISLTNPGTVGTVGSVPRLMPGQGAIIATGAMDYPAEYAGVAPETKAALGLSKVMTVTCTYDHRVIQGAESGMFLGRLADLLQGKDGFYEGVFESLGIPARPVLWQPDKAPALPGLRPAASEANKEAAILQLINAYRVRGHLMADINPLDPVTKVHPELDPETYGLSLWDLDREFHFGSLGALSGTAAPKPVCTLREILDVLRRAYCGKTGVEYMDIHNVEEKLWLQRKIESPEALAPPSAERRVRILRRLLEAEMFEQFLEARYKGQKRFSLEGGESAFAALDELCELSAAANVHEIVIGMPHRGRLTVIGNLIGQHVRVFTAFEIGADDDDDVKYHIGASGDRATSNGRDVRVTVLPNPSHLEAVNPVVEGVVRAKQNRLGDEKRVRVVPIAMHGDAAFMGQGVVVETMNLSRLKGYTTGGTIHIVVNNQVGFTTNPSDGRSSTYSTDMARAIQAPVFHVNGDDPEACVRAARLAFEYRQAFGKDVVIDVICYRKHGHNEGDDATYTQPLMYKRLKTHPFPAQRYRDRLIRQKAVSAEEVEAIRAEIRERLEKGQEEAKKNQSVEAEVPYPAIVSPATGIGRAMFEEVVRGLHALPDGFEAQDKIKGFIERRLKAIENGPIDWALGEALAFGSLLLEGQSVRLSGQDSTRGTFSQRHLGFFDPHTGVEFQPLSKLAAQGRSRFEVVNSSLSEFAVMGFDYGYSVADEDSLVAWEGQFGDFANGAQIIIDQFLSSGESKWGQQTSLVLLLPHGYEGQGPEHSSARIERFLQLCAERNMIVANCTTPAQYFHLLRRQAGLRKPLVVFTPKSILRHAKAVGHMADFTAGAFREVIGDSEALRARRAIFCTGKVYYDLLEAREKKQAPHVAIVRLEQLYPFPEDQVRDVLARYSSSAELLWVQEEPRNMGAWKFVEDRMRETLDQTHRAIRYVGRVAAASPATGSAKRHAAEQAAILDEAFADVLPAPRRAPRKKLVKRRKS